MWGLILRVPIQQPDQYNGTYMESIPPKTNMEPENELHEEEIPIKKSSFLGSI